MKISAYIPCFNNQETLGRAIASIRAQSLPVDELFVVDDCSTDGSAEEAASSGVRVIAQPQNSGRGAARATAMSAARNEFVLCCDAGKTLAPDFLEKAMPWFLDEKVAAVYGWLTQPPPANVVDRWSRRHLYKSPPAQAQHGARFVTAGAVVRASAVQETGGYDISLRLGEDFDLGNRLLARGLDVICDPEPGIISIESDTLAGVMERNWRWNTAPYEKMSMKEYLKQIAYSAKIMARNDLRDGDPLAALISLFSPHYQFWRR